MKHDIGLLREKLAGRRVVASVSGGKDSAAMSLHLRDLGIEHDRVFFDTGWEHPKTLAYLRGPLTKALGPIEEVRAGKLMEALILHKSMFPSRTRRFCTQELKVRPAERYLRDRVEREGVELVNAVGIRAEESEARSKFQEWEWNEAFDCETWRPLLRWTEEEVIAIHKQHGLPPNPLYLLGARRVGCWPCIYARKDEVRLVADTDPDRIDRIRELESIVSEAAGAERTFFSLWGDGTRACAGIDRVVAWSRTAEGGKNLSLFPSQPQDEGCMRWGLCDTGGAS